MSLDEQNPRFATQPAPAGAAATAPPAAQPSEHDPFAVGAPARPIVVQEPEPVVKLPELRVGMLVRSGGRDGVVIAVEPPDEPVTAEDGTVTPATHPYGSARVGLFAWSNDSAVDVRELGIEVL